MGGFADYGESEFPISKDKVFDAMCRAIPTIKGMKIDNADKFQGRIMVKADVTLWSWGENISIQFLELSENKTRVQITSSPKTGIGALDMGKNRKNIENILSTTSGILSSQQNQPTSTDNNQQTINNQTNNFQTNQTDFSGLSQYYQDEFKKIYESGESYKGKWNWAAFFFGAIWALTKGVWLAPVICIVASIFTYSIAGIIYWFIFGARGNYMYYCAYVKKKQLPI
jgi:hypothetical protein